MASTIDTAVDVQEWTPSPGHVLSQRYELVRLIGSGAHGEVWKALDLVNGHLEVAVKLLKMERASDQAKARFAEECSALELLMPHPHIVAIRARGTHDGIDYMVLELLRGISLADWLKKHHRGQLPDLQCVIAIFLQVCEGVSAAHRITSPGPIIHRDIKPENIMIIQTSCLPHEDLQLTAKVLDFGIVRLGDRRRTQAGEQLGTPLYMAPEQVAGEDEKIGPWSDVYALGVLLFELLTLQSVIDNEMSVRRYVIINGRRSLLKLLNKVRADVPVWLQDLLLRALEPKIELRIQSATQLLAGIKKMEQQRCAHSPSMDVSAHEFQPRAVRKWHAGVLFVMISSVILGLWKSSERGSLVSSLRQHSATASSRVAIAEQGTASPVNTLSAQPTMESSVSTKHDLVALQIGARHWVSIEQSQYWMGSSAQELQRIRGFCQSLSPMLRDEHCLSGLGDNEQPIRLVSLPAFEIETREVSNRELAVWLNQQTDLKFVKDPTKPGLDARWIRKNGVLWMDLAASAGHLSGMIQSKGLFSPRSGAEDHPSGQVTWELADSYCRGIGGRLPTEAEWERVARGSAHHLFPWGNEIVSCSDVLIEQSERMRCAGEGGRLRSVMTVSADSSAEGVLHLGGSVSEWVEDIYEDIIWACAQPCLNPVVKGSEKQKDHAIRVVRGGNIRSSLVSSRSAARRGVPADAVDPLIGFRCVRDVGGAGNGSAVLHP